MTQPIILGIDQPISEEIITLRIRNEYSGGIGGGLGLKLTVNTPYRLTVRFPEESKGMLELRFFNGLSTQVLNSESLLG